MIPLELKVAESYEAMSRQAADLIAGRLRRDPESVLLLPTGSTPLGMYRRLVEMHEQGLSFSRATLFNLDEYIGLSPKHPSSYRAYMQRELYRHVDADPRRIHFPDAAARDPEAEAARYEAEIEAAGGVDLCVLGIGRNGHIGFNEPGASFADRTRPVRLDDSTRRANARHFASEDSVPRRAITVGLGTILEAREVLLLASGESKAATVAAAQEGEITQAVPASALRGHPRFTLLADRAAAERLSR